MHEPLSHPLDQEFYEYLEYHLTRAFANSDDPVVSRFWCDGIIVPEVESRLWEEINHGDYIIKTTAWIGINGQDKYDTAIQLGPHALTCCRESSSLVNTIPNEASSDWWAVNVSEKSVYMKLL